MHRAGSRARSRKAPRPQLPDLADKIGEDALAETVPRRGSLALSWQDVINCYRIANRRAYPFGNVDSSSRRTCHGSHTPVVQPPDAMGKSARQSVAPVIICTVWAFYLVNLRLCRVFCHASSPPTLLPHQCLQNI